MASPLSMDLRIRVMHDLDSGMTVDQAAGKYSITSRTIFSWKKLRRETGAVIPRQGKTGPSLKLERYRSAICAALIVDHLIAKVVCRRARMAMMQSCMKMSKLK